MKFFITNLKLFFWILCVTSEGNAVSKTKKGLVLLFCSEDTHRDRIHKKIWQKSFEDHKEDFEIYYVHRKWDLTAIYAIEEDSLFLKRPKEALWQTSWGWIESLHILQNSQNLPLSAKQKQELDKFYFLLQSVHTIPSISQKITKILHDTGYLEFLKEDKETYQDRKENVEALIAKAIEWEKENSDLSLIDFLEELSLKQKFDEAHSMDPKIFLMTLHNSKGLEFHTCFIPGVEEDILPHINSKMELPDLEEERRLFYVGMTRAERRLTLTSTAFRFLWGISRPMKKSRFLEELPLEHLQVSAKPRAYF